MKSLHSLTFLAAAIAASTSLSANVVINTLPNENDGGLYRPDGGYHANAFMTGSATWGYELSRIWIAYNVTGGPHKGEIFILSDDNGAPGNVFYDFENLVIPAEAADQEHFMENFDVPNDETVLLQPNRQYWLAVWTNGPSIDTRISWKTTEDEDFLNLGKPDWDVTSPPFASGPDLENLALTNYDIFGTQAFRFAIHANEAPMPERPRDPTIPMIPEPSTGVALLLGSVVLWLGLRRRR